MEVSGKRAEEQSLAASVTKASAEDFEFYCGPCDSEGNHVEANGYCKNCEEFLCATCYTSHRRVRLTRNHILLDSKKMPTIQKPRKWDTECTEKCPQHRTEIIFYYCKTHDVVGCHECMASNHSDCSNDYIPDIASGTADSLEYKTILQELDDAESEALQKEKNANEDIALVGSCCTKAIEDMQKFKQDVYNKLDKMEQLSTAEARKAEENAVTRLKGELNDYYIVKCSVEGMKKDMKQVGIPASQIFVHMKLSKARLDGCRKILHSRNTCKSTRTFKFEPDMDVKDKFERNEEFGGLVFAKQADDMTKGKMEKPVVSNFCGKLNVKSSTDERNCEIFGIDMLSPKELVLADFGNMTVKIFCMQKCKITHARKLQSRPHSLTALNKDTVVVLMAFELIIMRKAVHLFIEKKRTLHSQSSEIRCIHSHLLVLFWYPFPKIDLLNQEGEILQTVLSDPDNRLLQYPQHVAVSTDMSIYVSDYNNKNKIVRLSIAGNSINVYESENEKKVIKQPRGIAVADDGSVFVCDFLSNNICMLSEDLSTHRILLTETEGINEPHSIHFCNKENKIFVGSCGSNEILIYSLHW